MTGVQELKALVVRTQGMQLVTAKSKGLQIKCSAFKKVKGEKAKRKAERFAFTLEGFHEAQQWKLELETAWEQGKLVPELTVKGISINEILNIVLADPEGWNEANVTETHIDNSLAKIRYFQTFVGEHRLLHTIDSNELVEYMKHLQLLRVGNKKDKLANGSINQYLIAVSKLFSIAKKRNLIKETPAFPRLKQGGGKEKRCFRFDVDDNDNIVINEEGEFYKWCETFGDSWLEFKMIMQVCCNTALRRIEIASAQCDWINMRTNTFTVPAEDERIGFKSKNRKRRSFKFNAQTRAIFKYFLNGRIGHQQLLRSHYPAVLRREKEENFGKFKWSKNKLTKCFNVIKAKCGIDDPNLTFHSTRHTAITRCVEENKHSAPCIQVWVGHSNLATTMGYFSTNEKHIDAVVDGITNHPASIKNSTGEATIKKTIYKPLQTFGTGSQKAKAKRDDVPIDFVMHKAANSGKRF